MITPVSFIESRNNKLQKQNMSFAIQNHQVSRISFGAKIVEDEFLHSDSADINIKVQRFLEKAIEEKRAIILQDVIEETGGTKQGIYNRIKTIPELKILWNKAIHKSLKGIEKRTPYSLNKAEETAKIKSIIQKAIDENRVITFADFPKEMGLSMDQLKFRIAHNPELQELWKYSKSHGIWHNAYPVQQAKQRDNLIKIVLEDAIKNAKPLTINDLAQQCSLSKDVCSRKIRNNEELKSLWESVKNNNKPENIHVSRKDTLTTRRERITQIRTALEKAIKTEKLMDYNDLSQATGLSREVCSHLIQRNDDLNELWKTVRSFVAEEEIQLVEKIKQIFEESLKNKEQILPQKIHKEFGISREVLYKRINEYPELQALWDKVQELPRPPFRKTTALHIQERANSRIDSIAIELIKSIEAERPIAQTEIAQKVGISYPHCHKLINSNPKLKELWNMALHTKVSEDSRQINENIRVILEDSIRANENISIDDIAKQTGLTSNGVSGRFNLNEDLAELWSQVRQNRAEILKNFTDLKLDNVPNVMIQEQLDLSDKVFKEVLDEYNNVRKLALNRSNSKITTREYLKWATLTKRDFELAVTKLFENMGYEAKATRYVTDGGVDVIASKDGKTTFIECTHLLKQEARKTNVLALEGIKHYYNADNVVLAASSGVFPDAKDVISKINKKNNSFKLMTLDDIILLAKEYHLDLDNLEKAKKLEYTKMDYPMHKNWLLKSVEGITDKDREEWKNLSKSEFMMRAKQIFQENDYKITKTNLLPNSFVIEKDGNKELIQFVQGKFSHAAEVVRALYGAKDVLEVNKVILGGVQSLTYATKDFIDTVNRNHGKTCAYNILSLDRLISLYKTLKL